MKKLFEVQDPVYYQNLIDQVSYYGHVPEEQLQGIPLGKLEVMADRTYDAWNAERCANIHVEAETVLRYGRKEKSTRTYKRGKPRRERT